MKCLHVGMILALIGMCQASTMADQIRPADGFKASNTSQLRSSTALGFDPADRLEALCAQDWEQSSRVRRTRRQYRPSVKVFKLGTRQQLQEFLHGDTESFSGADWLPLAPL